MAANSGKDNVLLELRRIVASPSFRGAERMGRFLEPLVLETVEGRGSLIKEYSVALEVFGKPDSFDPKYDSTVRSEASKLRTKLRLYYETDGREEPIIISIPKGGYTVDWRDQHANRTPSPPATTARTRFFPIAC